MYEGPTIIGTGRSSILLPVACDDAVCHHHGNISCRQGPHGALSVRMQADFVIFTNNNPRVEQPDHIIADIQSGLPAEVVNRHVGAVLPWFQDPHRVPIWYEKALYNYQAEVSLLRVVGVRTLLLCFLINGVVPHQSSMTTVLQLARLALPTGDALS